ncbi:hypothetical protein ACFX13_044396 [Malus domestica]
MASEVAPQLPPLLDRSPTPCSCDALFSEHGISYNAQLFYGAIKQRTGFVVQDDVMYPHLTVTETSIGEGGPDVVVAA